MMSTPSHRYTFPPTHRLKRQRLIRSLFDRSRPDVHTTAHGCVRALYRWAAPHAVGHDVPVQVGFAPGRGHPTNVQRTQVRRYLRETYRQHQHALRDALPSDAPPLIVMIVFRGASNQAATCIPRHLPRVLENVAHHLPPHASATGSVSPGS